MKLLDPDVAKAMQALGANVGQNNIETDPEKLKKQEQENAKRLEDAQKMEALGIDKAAIDQYLKNANEVMHTGNTGYGKELIPTDVLTEQVIDMVPKYTSFLGALPGYHGNNLAISQKVPVIGEVGYLHGNPEWTTGTPASTQGEARSRLATGEVQLNMASLILDVYISKRELNYSIVDLEALVKERLARTVARTAESMIINGDNDTGGTGNVNSDDQAPATTFAASGGALDHRILIDHGLRELAINGSFTVNGGTFDTADFISVMNFLGDLAANPSDCLWLFNRATYNKALGLDAFAKANERGEKSTISGNAITNIHGSDLFIARDLPNSEADGKVSATPANNTKGQFLYAYKPAIQHGYGQPMEIEVTKKPGAGVTLTVSVEWGFAIAQQLAGMTASSVAAAINLTL